MPFTVVWLKNDEQIVGTPFKIATIARRHAEDHLPINQIKIGATGVKIIDDDGTTVFQKLLDT